MERQQDGSMSNCGLWNVTGSAGEKDFFALILCIKFVITRGESFILS